MSVKIIKNDKVKSFLELFNVNFLKIVIYPICFSHTTIQNYMFNFNYIHPFFYPSLTVIIGNWLGVIFAESVFFTNNEVGVQLMSVTAM